MMFRAGRVFVALIIGVLYSAITAPGSVQAISSLTGIVAPATSLVIIVNNKNPVNELSIVELRRLLLGDVTRWPGGGRVTVAMREPGQTERDALLRLVCRMNEQDFTRYLLQATYRGDLQLGHKLLDTSTGMRRFVFNVPGSIGYVRGDEVDESVKVIKLVGALPDDPAFGLTLTSR
jgi:ABC-type phosphate transport system substrate-binding protein